MKQFDSEKFRSKMESLLGGQYVFRLMEITGASRSSIMRWVDNSYGITKKGPKPEYQNLISSYMKNSYGEIIMWGEFLIDAPSVLSDKRERRENTIEYENFDPYQELLECKKSVNYLENKINTLKNDLFIMEQENIKLRSKISSLTI